ncbi:hypothetical protein Plhal304r1_c055g0141271 [Plasmopara halstedii]
MPCCRAPRKRQPGANRFLTALLQHQQNEDERNRGTKDLNQRAPTPKQLRQETSADPSSPRCWSKLSMFCKKGA